MSTYNNLVGYIPKAGFASRINEKGWQNALVTIDRDGFRATGIKGTDIDEQSVILTIGDSFTFGDQVSDSETWPSCIELRTKRRTLNAGVFGYGAAQAVRRASMITKQRKIDTLILSILINDDFYRDRMSFQNGWPRPAVIHSENGLKYSEVSRVGSMGSIYYPYHTSTIFLVAKYSYLLWQIFHEIGLIMRTDIHNNAAEIDQIIEFTVRELSGLDVNNKFIVLQYSDSDFPSLASEVERIKELTFFQAQLADIPVIDTFQRIQIELTSSKRNIYNGHHTAYGNNIVCDEIYQVIQNN